MLQTHEISCSVDSMVSSSNNLSVSSNITIEWSSLLGKDYDIFWNTDLADPIWTFHSTHTGTGGTASAALSHASLGNPDRVFLRLQVD